MFWIPSGVHPSSLLEKNVIVTSDDLNHQFTQTNIGPTTKREINPNKDINKGINV